MDSECTCCGHTMHIPEGYETTDICNECAHAEVERLRAFAFDVMEAWPDGGLDGGELQDIAVKHGLLIPETRIESCGENCTCVDYGFPTNCHRRIDWLLTPN
jgi:hypothetical protein